MIRFFSPLKLVLLAALALTIVAGFIVIPAGTQLPVHWNIDGVADGFLPREWALLVPAAAVALIWGIFLAVDRVMNAEQREAGAYMVSTVITVLTLMFLGIAAGTVAIGLGAPVSVLQIIGVAIGLLLLVLGNAMPKSRPNGYAGIRMPTTLNSESNWQATHRLGGWLTIAGGLILIVATFTAPVNSLVWWIIACVILPMLIASGYSLWLARRAA